MTYFFEIDPAPGATADYRLPAVREPVPGQSLLGEPTGRDLETAGVHGFIPGHSGLYGIVVVNDNGGTGNYSVSVTANLVDAPDGSPAVAGHRIRGVAPNPSAGAMRVEFELARAGQAEFRLRDVAGRTIATVPAGHRGAGTSTFALDAVSVAGSGATGSGRGGRHVAPGVYFLSLVVDGVEASRTRIIYLR